MNTFTFTDDFIIPGYISKTTHILSSISSRDFQLNQIQPRDGNTKLTFENLRRVKGQHSSGFCIRCNRLVSNTDNSQQMI